MVLKRNIILIAIAAIVIIVFGTGIIIFLAMGNSSKRSRIQMENGATSEVGTTTPIMSTTTEPKVVCETKECKDLGARMRLLMNESTDPCHDFFEYSCGSFALRETEKNNEIEVQQSEDFANMILAWSNYSPVTKSEKIAKIFMEKCQNSKEDSELNEDIWMSEDLTELLNEVAKVEPVSTGFMKNEINFEPVGDRSGLVLVLRNGIEPKSNLDFVVNNIPTSRSMWGVENPIKVKDMPRFFTFIDLARYYNNLLPEENRNEFPNWLVYVQLADLYLMGELVQKLGVIKIKTELYQKWKRKLEGFLVKTEGKEHTDECVRKTFKMFPGTIAMIFIKKLVKMENIQKSNQIFENLKIVFNEMLDENTWIDEDLKNILREELKVLKASLGIPDEYKDLSNIDRMYARVEKEQKAEDQSYLTLVRNLLKMNSEETFLRVARMETVTFAAQTNAFDANYGSPSHRISFSPFLLNYPYIDENLPEWSYIATIGLTLGHEMGHAFDSVNLQFSPSLQQVPISESVKKEFDQRIDCISKKYDKFQFPDGSFSSGNQTKQEDSADMIGFNLAFRLFKKLEKQQKFPGFEEYTVEQSYFLRMANTWCQKELEGAWLDLFKKNPHSANKFRINGMMSNSVDFARAFGCKKGSPMNPEKKCPLFK